jgi:hypothetical protein
MTRTDLALAFTLGILAAGFCGGDRPLRASDEPQGSGDLFAVAGRGDQQGRETIFLVDTKQRKLAIYRLKENLFSLVAVRDFTWDMKFMSYENDNEKVRQTPSVQDVRRWERENREKREREEREKREKEEKEKPR